MRASHLHGPPMAERLRAIASDLTPKEGRVARVLFESAMLAGMETVAVLAGRARVSGATIIRLTQKLGFSGFAEFQKHLMAELEIRQMSPALLAEQALEMPSGEALEALRAQFLAVIGSSFDRVLPHEFAQAAEVIADPGRRLILSGGRFSTHLAELLYLHLLHVRPNVDSDRGCGLTRARLLQDLRPRTVLLVYDLRRYQQDTIRFAHAAKQAGAMVILLTDRWLSPIAGFADRVLAVEGQSPSPFDVMTGALALSEALLTDVMRRLGPAAIERLAETDRQAAAFAWAPPATRFGPAAADPPGPDPDLPPDLL